MIKINRNIQNVKLMYLLVFLCIFSMPSHSYEPVNKNIDPNTKELFEYLQGIYQRKSLSGYNVYGHAPDLFEQVGKNAAIWARDLQWFGEPKQLALHAKEMGYILTIHWHWSFDGDSAWTGKRKTAVNIKNMITPGTPENLKAMYELKIAADKLKVFSDAGIPILWRPLHEIDGGWFWWTDSKNPENTAQLWRMIYNYMTHERKLNNLIWVYSAGVGNKSLNVRQGFYPGGQYVDISGVDLYGVDYEKGTTAYWDYFNIMSQVSPNKMLALGESEATPNPDLMSQGKTPTWLYSLPWTGVPSKNRTVNWALFTQHHEHIITLDELPYMGDNKLLPSIGIITPLDEGSTWFSHNEPHFDVAAADRDGEIANVRYYANNTLIGENTIPPYNFTWQTVEPGSYDIVAKTTDNDGLISTSNNIRIVVGKSDIARNKTVVTSSGKNPSFAVDGDTYTSWSADKGDNAWLYVDLESQIEVDKINLHWGWKIHPEEFEISIATDTPSNKDSWHTVHTAKKVPYKQWKSTQKISFPAIKARYIRIKATKRAGWQDWGGYQLTAFEVPVNNEILESIRKKKQIKLLTIILLALTVFIIYRKTRKILTRQLKE
jgi:mannan endo-1,4-beta-mannosidase